MSPAGKALVLAVGLSVGAAPPGLGCHPPRGLDTALRNIGEGLSKAGTAVVDLGNRVIGGGGGLVKNAGQAIASIGGDGAQALGGLLEKGGGVVQDVGEKSAAFAASGVVAPSSAFVSSLAAVSAALETGDLKSAADHAAGAAAGVVLDSERALERATIDASDVALSTLPKPLEEGARHDMGELVKELDKKWPEGARLIRYLPMTSQLYNYLAALARAERPCDPQAVFADLLSQPNRELKDSSKELGMITTLGAKARGLSGWTATGCRATALGRVVYDAAYSTDGLITIDLQLLALSVGGQSQAVAGRYLRIEVLPLGRAHDFALFHPIRAGDSVLVSGPVFRDEDMENLTKLKLGKGWFEIHPVDDLEVLAVAAGPDQAAPADGVVGRFTRPAAQSSARFTYCTVEKGDTLRSIAERYYGVGSSRILVLANRSRHLEKRQGRLKEGWVLNVPVLTSKGLAVTAMRKENQPR
jgi:hypothetical protein